MPRAAATHPRRTRSSAKKGKKSTVAPVKAPESDNADGGSVGKSRPKRARLGASSAPQDTAESAKLSALLGLDKDPNLDVQEAFGSLLNSQDILGASNDSLAEEAEGEMSFRRASCLDPLGGLHYPRRITRAHLTLSP